MELLLTLLLPVVLLFAVLLFFAFRLWLKLRTSQQYNQKLFLRAHTLQTERDIVKYYLAAKGALTEAKLALVIRAVETQQPQLLVNYPELLKAYHKANK